MLDKWIVIPVIVVLLLVAWVILPLWWKRRQRNPGKVTLADLQLSITRLQLTIWQATITEIAVIIGLFALIR